MELVITNQTTTGGIPLIAGDRLTIPHVDEAAHDIHCTVCTVRCLDDYLQGSTRNILHRPLMRAHSALHLLFTAAKSRYRDTPRHAFQAISLRATGRSDASFPGMDDRFQAEENAEYIITALLHARALILTRADETRRIPINIHYLYRAESAEEYFTYDLPHSHFVMKRGIISKRNHFDEWGDTDGDIPGDEEHMTDDPLIIDATTFPPGGAHAGSEYPDATAEDEGQDRLISGDAYDRYTDGKANFSGPGLDILNGDSDNRRETYHFTADGELREYNR